MTVVGDILPPNRTDGVLKPAYGVLKPRLGVLKSGQGVLKLALSNEASVTHAIQKIRVLLWETPRRLVQNVLWSWFLSKININSCFPSCFEVLFFQNQNNTKGCVPSYFTVFNFYFKYKHSPQKYRLVFYNIVKNQKHLSKYRKKKLKQKKMIQKNKKSWKMWVGLRTKISLFLVANVFFLRENRAFWEKK